MGAPSTARLLMLPVTLLLTPVALTACGGDDGSSDASGDRGAGTAPAGQGTLATQEVPGFGTVLATGSGEIVYVHTNDPAGGSSCKGKCAREYRPLKVKGRLTAGAGADPALLSSFRRTDGTEQVLYDDKALYTHSGQGTISGAGVESFGGTWLLIEPSGDVIERTDTGGY
jgi:predicted lipoprotein with Yx(FWY)xxD motif